MAKPEWGTKRTCFSCGARFYDLRRETIVCPICSTVFDPSRQPRPKRSGSTVREERAAAPETASAKLVAVGGADDDGVGDEDDDSDGDDIEKAGDSDDDDVDDISSEDEEVIEDASELGEDDDDIGEVMEHVDDDSDDKS